MDTFSRHLEAARLLATAARQVAGSVKTVRNRYRRKGLPTGTGRLAEALLNLIQGALQLAAAAEHTSQTLLARVERRDGKAARDRGRPKEVKRKQKPGRKQPG